MIYNDTFNFKTQSKPIRPRDSLSTLHDLYIKQYHGVLQQLIKLDDNKPIVRRFMKLKINDH